MGWGVDPNVGKAALGVARRPGSAPSAGQRASRNCPRSARLGGGGWRMPQGLPRRVAARHRRHRPATCGCSSSSKQSRFSESMS